MGLGTSMYTALSGLTSNSQLLSVSGNNISNVNTTAFKRTQVSFETQISTTLKSGSSPTDSLGGTNPVQLGLGVRMGSTRKDFTSGTPQPTGISTNMAIDGNGFFIVEQNGSRFFTRDGGFVLDRDFNLVSPSSGALVQGYPIDNDYNIVEGVFQPINIPIGVMTIAEKTENVNLSGNLNVGGDIGTQGSTHESQVMYSDAAGTTIATETTPLDSLYKADGTKMFNVGDVITIEGVTRGGATVTKMTFEVGATNTTDSDTNGTTLQEYMDFMQGSLGIDTTQTGAGVTLNAGKLTVTGNYGTGNEYRIEDGNIIVNKGASPTVPFDMSITEHAVGESSKTSFIVYDSLGNELKVNMTYVLESRDDSGSTWRFYAQSDQDTDIDTVIGTGTIQFDNNGQYIGAADAEIILNRDGTGAETPQSINLNFNAPNGQITSLQSTAGQVSMILQDGSALGTLEDFTVSANGVITGVFSNSLLRNLGQIPLAMFANNEGLEELGGNLYRASTNSGTPIMVAPTSGGSGKVIGRAVEGSNVDLAEEFLNMINASTGFSANSRVMSTSNSMMQELLSTIR
ncbi:Flagellar hook protein FlgE [Poriferisphaera corsica]|uniref:Flagellar hook protein FlgE n=1 Tax=Poriferisphaera corsica TaxID=2528020 RepID=A0A517YSH2_9BACT|nr:flagellar hook-basal body complex protein [Poriferisphaera corsica]QDU33174.1 Flagellar hook protein FlgE [Poriferisphaera corsica]